jgi:hypothetical protein
MSHWLILIVGAIYLYVAIELFFFSGPNNIGLGLTFFAYALGNVGMAIAVLKY